MTNIFAMNAQFYRPFRDNALIYIISNWLTPIANACRPFWATNLALKGRQISGVGASHVYMGASHVCVGTHAQRYIRIIAPKVR